MSALTVLRDARNLITEHGWTKGEYGNKELGFCAVGAMMEAANTVPGSANDYRGAQIAFRDHIPEDERSWTNSIVTWNDSLDRQKDDVLAVFDKAIQAESEKVQW